MDAIQNFLGADHGVKVYVITASVAMATAGWLYILYRKRSKAKKAVVVPPDTVMLYQLGRGPHAPSLSPFPLKLETYLRIAKIPYLNNLSQIMSSKGKTPWISYNGTDVADSQLSMNFLNDQLKVDLNRNLSKEQRGIARAIQVMVDEHLYWCLVYFRWVHDKEKIVLKLAIPSYLIRFVVGFVSKQLHGQGMGRHSTEEVKSFMLSDLTALSECLGDKKFMMGDQGPTEVDCSVFGMLSQMIWHQQDAVMGGLIQAKYPSLYQYCLRMKETIWPDWDQCVTHGPAKEVVT